MQSSHRFTAISLPVVLTLLLSSLSGCGGKPAKVSGTVSVDGVPLNQGTVSYVPAGGGLRAVAQIESDGSYKVRTNREMGLEIGEYKVAVSSREVIKPEGGGLPMPGKYLAPQRYGRIETSDLQYTVEKGSNVIDIELSSDSK